MSLALIRQSMCTAVKAILPLLHSGDPFREHDSSVPFLEFCEQNPASAWRLFYIRGTGAEEPSEVISDLEWVWTEMECAVAYPRDYRAGDLMGNDLDDLIESDLRQLNATIGTAGYSTLENAASGTVMTQGVRREEGEACLFGVLTLRVGFWRAMP